MSGPAGEEVRSLATVQVVVGRRDEAGGQGMVHAVVHVGVQDKGSVSGLDSRMVGVSKLRIAASHTGK